MKALVWNRQHLNEPCNTSTSNHQMASLPPESTRDKNFSNSSSANEVTGIRCMLYKLSFTSHTTENAESCTGRERQGNKKLCTFVRMHYDHEPFILLFFSLIFVTHFGLVAPSCGGRGNRAAHNAQISQQPQTLFLCHHLYCAVMFGSHFFREPRLLIDFAEKVLATMLKRC